MPNASVAAIITKVADNCPQILLTLRRISPFENKWCLPGGYIEQNETSKDAIIREVKEETGINFQPRFFGTFDEIFAGINFHNVVTVFDGVASGTCKAQETEVEEIKWFSLSDASSLDLAFSHKTIINEYLTRRNSAEYKNELLEEYKALRDDIIKRTELRNQVLTFTLVIAGTFFSVGAQKLVDASVLLIYPILATFLAATWAQLDNRIGEIGEYIRNQIETQLAGLGWENFMRSEYSKPKNIIRKRLSSYSASGIFIVSQILAVVIAYHIKLTFSPIEITLLILDLFFFFITLFLVSLRRMIYKRK